MNAQWLAELLCNAMPCPLSPLHICWCGMLKVPGVYIVRARLARKGFVIGVGQHMHMQQRKLRLTFTGEHHVAPLLLQHQNVAPLLCSDEQVHHTGALYTKLQCHRVCGSCRAPGWEKASPCRSSCMTVTTLG